MVVPHRWARRFFISALSPLTLTAVVGATEVAPAAGWHLLRTANPAGGDDAVSMTRGAEMSSNMDLAGLMLRCHGGGAEVVLVVVTPFSRHAQPAVTLEVDGKQWHFEASIIPPGAQLLLPPAAAALAAGAWQSSNQLTVRISWHERSIAGAIPIDGLRGAIATLIANCPAG